MSAVGGLISGWLTTQTIRAVATITDMSVATLWRRKKSPGSMTLDEAEKMLAVLGCRLTVEKIKGPAATAVAGQTITVKIETKPTTPAVTEDVPGQMTLEDLTAEERKHFQDEHDESS